MARIPGRLRRTLRPLFDRLRRRGVERIVAAPATERVVGRLHRAAANLAEVTSEVSAYAELLEEKTGELHDRTRARKKAAG
ncbi:hypothetical protein [Thermoactinospora rubra]|uniref:hypothetical protein n=1 Tax=Thermoactinospora rubra TaxID=1088767 RepID=UPI000A1162DB|nr:hypothetical protein [Thermoactinospora rubra]